MCYKSRRCLCNNIATPSYNINNVHQPGKVPIDAIGRLSNMLMRIIKRNANRCVDNIQLLGFVRLE